MRNFRLSTALAAIACFVTLGFASFATTDCLAQAPVPVSDILVFTNGDQLTGKLVRGLDGNITFKSDMAGEITVSLDKVKSLRVGANFAVLRKDTPVTKQSVVPGSFAIEDSKLTLALKTEPVEVLPVKNVAYIIDEATYRHDITARQGILQGWNGAISGGATAVRSSSNGSTFNMGIALIRVAPLADFLPKRNRTTVDFTETYGKLTQSVPAPAVTVKTSIMHADAERDEYISSRSYLLGQTSFDHNYAQGLDLQQVYGGGIGWTVIQKPNQQLDLKADIHYEKQKFFSIDPTVVAPASLNLIGSTLSEAYHRNLPRKIVLSQTANILPAFNNSKAYSANASVILAMPVFKRLSLTVTTTDNFLNNPAPGYQKNSYQFITGVSYVLR